MVIVFSQASAFISPDFVSAFPTQFHFDGLLNKICEDTSVSLSSENGVFLLQGKLESLLSVQNMLVSSHAVFGTNTTLINEVPPQSSRPFSALVEAAEAMSRGDELQQPTLGDSSFVLKNDHDYVSQMNTSLDCHTQPFPPLSDISRKSREPFLPSDDSETNITAKSEEDLCYEEFKTETESDLDSNPDVDMLDLTVEVQIGRSSCEVEMPNDDTKTEGKILHCNLCQYITQNHIYLKHHINFYHSNKQIKCDKCDKIFKNVRYLRRHEPIHQPDPCTYNCEICGKIYKGKKNFKQHIKTHESGFNKEVLSCGKCEKTFASKSNLAAHINTEHLGIRKNFLCQICGKSFTSKNAMLQHHNVHTGDRPYICNICGKDFCYESSLREHRNTHEKNKVFNCDYPDCDKTFHQRSALKIHKEIHKEKKEFVCKECGRGFTQKQALHRHERAHKGLKPFKCVYCSRTFGDPSVIRRHIQHVHKVNKEIDRWREDVIELTDEELKAFDNAPIPKQSSPVKQVILPAQIATGTLGQTTIATQLNTINNNPIKTEPIPISSKPIQTEPVIADNRNAMVNNTTPLPQKLVTLTPAQPIQASMTSGQISVPNIETIFLIRPTANIQFIRQENCDTTTTFGQSIPGSQSTEFSKDERLHTPLFNENLDGTFSTVTQTAQKGKLFEPFLRPVPSLDSTAMPEQTLEQLKPDGTLADSSMSLSDEGVCDSDLTSESLSQFYSYYNSLTGQLPSHDTTPIKQ